MFLAWRALVICLVLTVPCFGGTVVRLGGSDWIGTGFVVGRHLVMTVGHCVPRGSEVWVGSASFRASVVSRSKMLRGCTVHGITGDKDDVVLLLTQQPWKESDYFEMFPGGRPWSVSTLRYDFRIFVGAVVPGDSGSPVLDKEGRVVGLVWGRILPRVGPFNVLINGPSNIWIRVPRVFRSFVDLVGR